MTSDVIEDSALIRRAIHRDKPSARRPNLPGQLRLYRARRLSLRMPDIRLHPFFIQRQLREKMAMLPSHRDREHPVPAHLEFVDQCPTHDAPERCC